LIWARVSARSGQSRRNHEIFERWRRKSVILACPSRHRRRTMATDQRTSAVACAAGRRDESGRILRTRHERHGAEPTRSRRRPSGPRQRPGRADSGSALPTSIAAGVVVSFDRRELRIIFDLYGAKVAGGEWRDYALDFTASKAVFSIFRRAARPRSIASRKIRVSRAGRGPIASSTPATHSAARPRSRPRGRRARPQAAPRLRRIGPPQRKGPARRGLLYLARSAHPRGVNPLATAVVTCGRRRDRAATGTCYKVQIEPQRAEDALFCASS